MLLRTLFIFLRKNWLSEAGSQGESQVTMRVLPVDLDLLLHVNNGFYFSYMDFNRWDVILRNGSYALAKKNGRYSVTARDAIKFK